MELVGKVLVLLGSLADLPFCRGSGDGARALPQAYVEIKSG
jgi:hypothetical protein